VSIRAWLEADGIDPASFSSTLKQWLSRTVDWVTPIHRLETGELAIADFEEVFAEALRTVDGRPIDASGILDRMLAQMQPDPAMFELVEALREQGIKVGLLSNSWGNTYPRERIDALFDPVVISGEGGLRKPQPEIYRHALDLLDVTPGRTLFVDDGEPNLPAAQGEEVMGVHLRGAFLMTRTVQRFMTEAGHGRIVTMSSTSAQGNRGQVNYAAAKGGLESFTKTLAIELRKFGITANAIAPGVIDTPMLSATAERVGRAGIPDDIAQAVSFFVDESSSYVNGQVLAVAGGPSHF
jgi:putative hydrolase of the HAD superfamily